MKLIKGLRQFLKSKFSGGKKRRPAPRPPRDDRSGAPKNGRLAVAVIVSVLIMIALGVINIRLIRDPSIALKAFGPIFSNKTQPAPKSPACPVKETKDGKPGASRTPMEFYVTLNQDEAAPQTDARAPEQQADAAPNTKTGDQKEDSKQKSASRTPGTEAQQPQLPIPEAESRPKTYTVQVGAFSHPAIAQEWAQKWKSRGYDPMLRPVARPKTGVIYRLYLGKFTSEKKADELVQRLKSKEGINALRLLVRE